MNVFCYWRVDGHQDVDVLNMQGGVPLRARHRRIDFRKDALGRSDRSRNDVDRNAEADITELVRRRDLNHRNVDRLGAARNQFGDPRQLDRNVFRKTLCDGRANIRTYEKGPMPILGECAAPSS